MRLFVGSLSRAVTTRELEELFAPYGGATQIYWAKRRGATTAAFLTCPRGEDAIAALNDTTLRHLCISVRQADFFCDEDRFKAPPKSAGIGV